MKPWKLLSGAALGLVFALSGAVACGARTGLLVPDVSDAGGRDAGADAHRDALPDVAPDVARFDCAEAGVTYIYLITAENELLSFDPTSLSFSTIGTLDCPAGAGATPFSMGVDRKGTAYVVFNSGELFQVSTADATCTPTSFVPGQQGFQTFGMGFSTDQNGPSETLYVAEISFMGPSKGLGSIDTKTFDLSFIGPFDSPPGNEQELTGTGDGRLYAFFLDASGSGSHLVEVDKATGGTISSVALPFGNPGSALAFAFWGGDFYVFTSPGAQATTVTRYSPKDGSIAEVGTLDLTVVGAGVSTCAPQ